MFITTSIAEYWGVSTADSAVLLLHLQPRHMFFRRYFKSINTVDVQSKSKGASEYMFRIYVTLFRGKAGKRKEIVKENGRESLR